MCEQANPDQASDAGEPADDDCHQLLEAMADTDEVEHPDGRQQPNEVADKDNENADVEEVRAPHQFSPSQQLARPRLPRVRLAIKANETAEQEHGQAEIGIPAEHDVIDGVAHGAPQTRLAWRYVTTGRLGCDVGIPGAGRRAARTLAAMPSLPHCAAATEPGPKVTSSSSQAASSAARSWGSSSLSRNSAARASLCGQACASACTQENTDE